jgi:UDP-sugar transporter A1/2/3
MRKWTSLVILTIGVAIVQISGSGDQHTNKDEDADTASHNRLVGLVAVLCAACTSGFSGVYFEKILKGSTTSLWLRNVQMGLPSILIAFITVFVKDSAAVTEHGFLGGYSPIVWTVVTVQAAGGLIVAVVVKYADNGKERICGDTSVSTVIYVLSNLHFRSRHPSLTRAFSVNQF